MQSANIFFIARRIGFSLGRDRSLSFAIMVPAFGLGLGVMVLVVVLSVINGFQDALQTQVLRFVPHVVLYTDDPPKAGDEVDRYLAERTDIASYGPFVEGLALASVPGVVLGAQVSSLIFGQAEEMAFFERQLDAGSRLPSAPFELLAGSQLAQTLGISPGDSLTLTAPTARVTPLGLFPRYKSFRLVGTFSTATTLDSTTVFAADQDIRRLFVGQQITQGWWLRLQSLFQARSVASHFLLSGHRSLSGVTHWMRSHGSLYEAINTQKAIMWLLLSLLIAVAVFNVVSSLNALVVRKRADIAILMTLGAVRRQIIAVFRWLAVLVSLCGVGFGLCLGVVLAWSLEDAYLWFERVSGARIMTQYFVNYLPVRVLATDLLIIVFLALMFCLLAAVLPARQAAMVRPAEILRNE